MPDALDAILQPGRLLTMADVLALSERLEPAWRVRQRRLDARDTALREARALFPLLGVTAAARAISRALDAHLRGSAVPGTELLERVAALNDRRPISPRQVLDVLRGARSTAR